MKHWWGSGGGRAGERGLMPFLRAFVPVALRERVTTVTLQQVVAAVRASGSTTGIELHDAGQGGE